MVRAYPRVASTAAIARPRPWEAPVMSACFFMHTRSRFRRIATSCGREGGNLYERAGLQLNVNVWPRHASCSVKNNEVRHMRTFFVILAVFAAGASYAHPGAAIAVSKNGVVYFVDTGAGVFSIDASGRVVRREGPAF